MIYEDDKSHGMFVEKGFPHVQLVVRELGNRNFEFHDQVSQISLTIDEPSLSDNVFSLFSGDSFSRDFLVGSVQVFECMGEPKKRFLK